MDERVVHHDHAARAHDGAELASASRSPPACRGMLSGMQPPEGPPVCTALKARPSGMPPPISKMMSRRVDAHRHFDQSRQVDAAGQREDLGALAALRADAGEPLAAVANDGRDVGKRLDVVDQRGMSPQTGLGRIRRPWPRLCRARLRWTRSARSLRRTQTRPRPSGWRCEN